MKFLSKLDRGFLIRLVRFQFIMIIALLFIMAGVSMNFKAVSSNRGRMPVYSVYFNNTDKHFGFTNFSEVNYPYLTDIIHLGNIMWSVGDLIMIIALSVIIYFYLLLIYNYQREKKEKEKLGRC